MIKFHGKISNQGIALANITSRSMHIKQKVTCEIQVSI